MPYYKILISGRTKRRHTDLLYLTMRNLQITMNKNNFDSALIVLEVTYLKHCPWESHQVLTLGVRSEVRPTAFRR